MKRDTGLSIAGITKHQYYYRPKGKKRGRKPSEHTLKITSNKVKQTSNTAVVENIKEIHKDHDTEYGYHKMTIALMILGFIINHKKVYRLMKENLLLNDFAKKKAENLRKIPKSITRRTIASH